MRQFVCGSHRTTSFPPASRWDAGKHLFSAEASQLTGNSNICYYKIEKVE